MKNYASENAFFRLPFNFDLALLRKDLTKCMEFEFQGNYIPDNYDGKDYILPLRSIDGRLDQPAAIPDNQHRYQSTPALSKCKYFNEVINQLKCKKEAVRIMKMPSGAVINTHTDDKCGYEDGVFRLHLPIQTNDDVHFIVNETRLIMEHGSLWYANFNLPHSVANNGSSDRIHLVIDCIRNDWTDHLFRSLGYDFELEYDVPEQYSTATKKMMIEQLELQDTPASRALIEQLKSELDDI